MGCDLKASAQMRALSACAYGNRNPFCNLVVVLYRHMYAAAWHLLWRPSILMLAFPQDGRNAPDACASGQNMVAYATGGETSRRSAGVHRSTSRCGRANL
eukprot:6194432-Pleurochrysis_carterae.AAC.6